MAYCGDRMVENLKKALSDKGRDRLDYVLLSHSHYDHMGALPFIKKDMPDAVVCGSEHCRDILKRPGAKKMMKSLGTAARDLYEPDSDLDIPVDGIGVDMVLKDGDRISLGEEYIWRQRDIPTALSAMLWNRQGYCSPVKAPGYWKEIFMYIHRY